MTAGARSIFYGFSSKVVVSQLGGLTFNCRQLWTLKKLTRLMVISPSTCCEGKGSNSGTILNTGRVIPSLARFQLGLIVVCLFCFNMSVCCQSVIYCIYLSLRFIAILLTLNKA